jgi:WD40 repeat protein
MTSKAQQQQQQSIGGGGGAAAVGGQVAVTASSKIDTVTFENDRVRSCSYSKDGKFIAVGTDQKLTVLSATGEMLFQKGGWGGSVTFTADSQKVVGAGCLDVQFGVVGVFSVNGGGDLLHELKGHTQPIHSVSCSNDGKLIASGSHDKTLRLWSTGSGEVKKFTLSDDVQGVAFSHDTPTTKCVAASEDGKVSMYYVQGDNIQLLISKRIHSGAFSCAFSPDNSNIISSGFGDIIISDAETLAEIKKITVTSSVTNIFSVSFSPSGTHFAAATEICSRNSNFNKSVIIYDSRTFAEVCSFTEHTDSVHDVSFAPDNKHLLSASSDKTLRCWSTEITAPFQNE